jgi:small subunit ribosomal protein S4e
MHLKLLNVPKTWKISKKKNKFSVRINPGAHPKDLALPCLIIVRDYLSIANNKKECKKILHNRMLLVDNKSISDYKYAIGLFDVVSLPNHKMFYRVSLDYKGRLCLIDIDKKESEYKPLKILNKIRVGKKITQLNCSSGINILVKKDVYKTGDTVLYDLKNKKITKHVKIEKKKLVFITKGKHAGTIANITEFKPVMGPMPDRVLLTDTKGKSFETLEEYVFVIGDKKPEFKVV